MSKRFPTEQEAVSSMHKLTAMMVHHARRFDRVRAALADLSEHERLGIICETLGIDIDEFLDWVTSKTTTPAGDTEAVARGEP